jgi:hypothetical protein
MALKTSDRIPSVYRIVVSGVNNKLSLLVAVDSSDPAATLKHYMDHAAIKVLEAPVLIPNRDLKKPGIDFILREKDKAPYYEIVNRLRLSKLDLILLDANTKDGDLASYWSNARI